MFVQKLIIIFITSIVLCQSVLASTDTHLTFEDTNTHHSHHELASIDLDQDLNDVGDDCSHCCNAHGSSLYITSHDLNGLVSLINEIDPWSLESLYYSYYPPAFIPPIT